MDLSVIIINYKSAKLVLDCVESIYRQTHKYLFEIIIVDNNSEDDCKEQVLSKYPDVQWLQLDYNAGFARANNAGIAIAKGEFILLFLVKELKKNNRFLQFITIFIMNNQKIDFI